ncbi:DUF2057 family protein [Alcanivorax sp. 1008]|uniref:DUF2057 family protein n=1 Tax=Alcanivorax sp. 1008 TaxID=2816853 RepID=UPI001D562499|nr:DUF2057 family protein [Alcanivorax sp. 1008]MCC1496929.1 DUF2057 family protein [Alcanivorax sp. 1008]
MHLTAMRLTAITLFALLSACAQSPVIKLYEGSELPPQQLLLIDVPVELEIVTINDRRLEGINKLFGFGDRTLQLQPGDYRITAYYKNLFELSDNEHDVVKSDPVLFRVTGQAGERHRLAFDVPADVEAAKQMAKQFSGYSVDLSTGQRRPTEASGMMLSQGFLSVPTAQPAPLYNSVAPAAEGLSHSDLLKASWRNATAEERREFLRWIAEQGE